MSTKEQEANFEEVNLDEKEKQEHGAKQPELKRGYRWVFIKTAEGLEKVQGKKKNIDGIPDFDFVVVGESGEWVVAEFETGVIITEPKKTQKEAKETAYYTIKQNSQAFKDLVNSSKKVNNYAK